MSDRLTEIAARATAATAGPWRVERDEPTLSRLVCNDGRTLEVDFGYVGNNTQPDAEFVAHAREDVPWLLAEVERLTAERDEVATAAARANEFLQALISDSADPGTDALGAQYVLSRLLDKLSFKEPISSDYLSRFSVLPAEIHTFLSRHLAEDVHLRYQQAIGSHAVEQAAKHLRMAAACQQAAGEITSPREYRAAADDIDPMKRGSGGPFPTELIRFGTEGGDAG